MHVYECSLCPGGPSSHYRGYHVKRSTAIANESVNLPQLGARSSIEGRTRQVHDEHYTGSVSLRGVG
jgi:hypothetical protein